MEVSLVIAIASGVGTAIGSAFAAYRKKDPPAITTKEDIDKSRALKIEGYVQGEKIDRIFQALIDLKESIASLEEARETTVKIFDVVEHFMRRADHRFKITSSQLDRLRRIIEDMKKKEKE